MKVAVIAVLLALAVLYQTDRVESAFGACTRNFKTIDGIAIVSA